jgi:hypothetical protein
MDCMDIIAIIWDIIDVHRIPMGIYEIYEAWNWCGDIYLHHSTDQDVVIRINNQNPGDPWAPQTHSNHMGLQRALISWWFQTAQFGVVSSIYVCMYVCLYVSIYVSMYLCIYVSMYVCTLVWVC